MKPYKNFIMLSPIASEKITAAGIILPDSEDRPTNKGKVLQVGDNVNAKMKNGKRIEAGDVLNYFPEKATELTYEGTPVVLVNVANIVTRD